MNQAICFKPQELRIALANWTSNQGTILTCKPGAVTKLCAETDGAKSFLQHITYRLANPTLPNIWLWHGGVSSHEWIQHSAECLQSTNAIMQELEKMKELTGLPAGWWTIMQSGNSHLSVADCNTKSRLKTRTYLRETMYQGNDDILQSIFATDVGDATFYFVALGFVGMPKTLIEAYSSMTTAYLLCEVGTDYDIVPLRDLQYAWAYGLNVAASEHCDSDWIRQVYVPTLLGVAVRRCMGRKPYVANAVRLDPVAWWAARIVHSGSYAVVGMLLYQDRVNLGDKSRALQAVAMALAHDVFEEKSDVKTGDTPNITPAVRALLKCDGLTAYIALLCSKSVYFGVKRACVGWTLATLEGKRWAKSVEHFDFREVKREHSDIAGLTGGEPLGETMSVWRRCQCGKAMQFPRCYTLIDLARFTRAAYLDSAMQVLCWCAYDRAYDILTADYLLSIPSISSIS